MSLYCGLQTSHSESLHQEEFSLNVIPECRSCFAQCARGQHGWVSCLHSTLLHVLQEGHALRFWRHVLGKSPSRMFYGKHLWERPCHEVCKCNWCLLLLNSASTQPKPNKKENIKIDTKCLHGRMHKNALSGLLSFSIYVGSRNASCWWTFALECLVFCKQS